MNVVVLGGGYAGVSVTRRLEKRLPEDVRLILIDDTGDHLIQHELHRVVRRPSFAEEIVIPLDDLVDHARIRVDRVTAIDHESGVVHLAASAPIEYDYAAVCLGAETNFYGLPGVKAHATPLKRIEDAHTIRTQFFDVVEDDGGSIVVGGAGLSGIQVAGELAELAREQGVGDRFSITMLEQFDSVAPDFPPNFQQAVHDELEIRGIDVRTATTVESADEHRIRLAGGENIEYDQFVWTGGIRGSTGLGGDRPRVRSTMRRGDGTFVLGDAATVVDADGEIVPASAQAAVREAPVVANNILRLVEHTREGDGLFEPRLDRFDFGSPGWLVSVGNGAVAQVGPAVFRGTPAKALKTTIGASYLSSVGAHRRIAEFVSEEFGQGRDRAAGQDDE